MNSGNGNYVRYTVEENNDDELKYSDKKNIFEIILRFFEKISEIFNNCLDNSILNKSNKIDELLMIIGIICFNFYYKEECPLEFNIILEKIKILKKKKIINENNSLYKEIEKCLNYVKNKEILIKSCCNEKDVNYNDIEIKYFSSFENDVLERIIKNSNNENFIEMSFEDNYKIISHIKFLINNSKMNSIFNKSFISSNIEIKYGFELYE
jgi:hypothetical protein